MHKVTLGRHSGGQSCNTFSFPDWAGQMGAVGPQYCKARFGTLMDSGRQATDIETKMTGRGIGHGL